MERNNYPVLRNRPELVYLDASNGFPLHEAIIESTTTLASQYVGMPGKGAYSDATAITGLVEAARQKVARLIGADTADIYFVSSASEAIRLIAEAWHLNHPTSITAYAPEDHLATLQAVKYIPLNQTRLLLYNDIGELHGTADDATVFFLSQMHHLYGTDIATATFKQTNPNAKLAIDVSQSISRMQVDVTELQADALYFSGHKLGAIPGAGVLYIAPEHRAQFNELDSRTTSLPWLSIVSIGTAIDILLQRTMHQRNLYLAQITNYLIERLEQIQDISFSKGVAGAVDTCAGNGVVSFVVRGYNATDIMMLCNERDIAIRGGDHCVSPKTANKDLVRVSMQAYTTEMDIDRLIETLKNI